MKNSSIIIIIIILVVAAAALFYFKDALLPVSVKRKWLQSLDNHTSPYDVMSDQEISDCYDFLKNYAQKGKTTVPEPLKASITAISEKYNIFT